MAVGELCWRGVSELAALYRQRAVSPTEVLQDSLDWLDLTGAFNKAYVTVAVERAREDAEQAEAAFRAGDDYGPLHGITYSVKDVIAVGELPQSCGTRAMPAARPRFDAHAIGRLREARAVCLGKVTTHEFSAGFVCPPTTNPWDGASVPGGSSGGSASAVAAGQCTVSIAADTGCSIRQPAALCGVSGLRPTLGRISTSGCIPASMTADTVGPMARSARDIAAVLRATAGFDARDPLSRDVPVDDYDAHLGLPLEGLRVGVPANFFFERLEPAVEAAVGNAIRALADNGAHTVEVTLPHAHRAATAFWITLFSEAAALHDERRSTGFAGYGDDVRQQYELGNLLLAKDYLRAQQIRTLVREDFECAFDDVDVIVVPTVPATARVVPQDDDAIEYSDGTVDRLMRDSPYCRFTVPISIAGCPAVSVPCGFDARGMPIGIQIAARPFAEGMALRVAHAFQQVTDWHQRRPTALVAFARSAVGGPSA